MHKLLVILALIALALCFDLISPGPALTQTTQGNISGVVIGADGTFVSSASVIAINEGTGEHRVVTTTSDGQFLFTALSPGTYKVKVDITGFKSSEMAGVNVSIGQVTYLRIGVFLGSGTRTLGEIRMRTVDKRGLAVPDAVIAIVGSRDSDAATGISDHKGEYVYSNALPGNYTIKVVGQDGTHSEKHARLRKGQVKKILLELR